MRAATRFLLIAAVAAAAPACHKNAPPPDQNFAIDNNTTSPTDIEALPADESSATPSNELVNGEDNADVNDLGNGNSD
jgi:hypothetical protein